jgi:hypothetical protein
MVSVAGWTGPDLGDAAMQTTRPRDLGALLLIVGVFVVLLVTSVLLGAPPLH